MPRTIDHIVEAMKARASHRDAATLEAKAAVEAEELAEKLAEESTRALSPGKSIKLSVVRSLGYVIVTLTDRLQEQTIELTVSEARAAFTWGRENLGGNPDHTDHQTGLDVQA